MTNDNRYNDTRSKPGKKTMDWTKVFKKKTLLDKIVERLRKIFPNSVVPVIQPVRYKSYSGFGGHEYQKRVERG